MYRYGSYSPCTYHARAFRGEKAKDRPAFICPSVKWNTDYFGKIFFPIDYFYDSQVYSFDGEGAITSAIDYVVSEELPQIYVLEGHGEAELSTEMSDQVEKENMELVQFSLLNADEIPEDADCILINAPSSDISEEEKDMLSEYVTNGGKLLVIAGPVEEGELTNLTGLLADYGVETAEGIVVEGDRSYYAFSAPYIMLPDIQSHNITDPLIESNYYVIMPIAQGLKVNSTNNGEGQMIWIASSDIVDVMYNAYSSGANLDFTMNALSSLLGEREAVAIRSKSLGYNYLTMDESTSSMLQTVMIGVLPLSFAILGVFVIVERRKRRNEES